MWHIEDRYTLLNPGTTGSTVVRGTGKTKKTKKHI